MRRHRRVKFLYGFPIMAEASRGLPPSLNPWTTPVLMTGDASHQTYLVFWDDLDHVVLRW
jgi:hypothetical protein